MTTENRIRVTHREREAVAEELRTAYTVGCLDDDELEDRTGRAYAAKIRGELAALVCDLPAMPAPGDAGYDQVARSAPGDWPGQVQRAVGRLCWLMLAAAGAWLIAVAAGAAAVPLICLWLALMQLRGRVPQWCRRFAEAALISRFPSVENGPVPDRERT